MYYKNLGDSIDKRLSPPKNLSQENWNALCNTFEMEEFKKRSEQNSENRAQLPVNHHGGSKPFVRYREEHRDAEMNQECGRIELYRITHFNESKGWINSIAEKNYEDMLALKAQPVAEGSNEMTEDAIWDIVLGMVFCHHLSRRPLAIIQK
ncbi:hypothetical protein ACHQM5_014061 [Ranunculus cassubicifolius]